MFPISSGDQELQIVVIICIETQSLDVKIMLIMRCKCPIPSAGRSVTPGMDSFSCEFVRFTLGGQIYQNEPSAMLNQYFELIKILFNCIERVTE